MHLHWHASQYDSVAELMRALQNKHQQLLQAASNEEKSALKQQVQQDLKMKDLVVPITIEDMSYDAFAQDYATGLE